MHFIAKSEVLSTLEDDNDIEWKLTPDELLTIIQLEGSHEKQEKLICSQAPTPETTHVICFQRSMKSSNDTLSV